MLTEFQPIHFPFPTTEVRTYQQACRYSFVAAGESRKRTEGATQPIAGNTANKSATQCKPGTYKSFYQLQRATEEIFGPSAVEPLCAPQAEITRPTYIRDDPPISKKRPAQQITRSSVQDGPATFRTHCERLLRAESPETKRQKMYHKHIGYPLRLTFEKLPDHVFDSSGIEMRKFIVPEEPCSDSDSQGSDSDRRYTDKYAHDIYFLVAMVNPIEARFVETEPQTLRYGETLMFTEELYRLLPAHKCFFLWIQVFTAKGRLVTEAVSPSLTILHDGLKDTPPEITADVCFFPQKVVIDHLNNCNSKATLSKRHKKGKLKEGAKWCRNPSCGAKATCSCQAYPSRILKKYIREVKDLLERERTAPAITEVVKAAQDLYNTLNITADQQTKKLPTYESFLNERIRRWKLFLRLKEYASTAGAVEEIRDKMNNLQRLLPPL